MKLQRKGIFHLYFRDIFLVIAPLLFLLYVNYHHIRYLQLLDDPHNPLGHLSLLRDTFQVSIYCFIFFAFISYYFLEKARGASLLECLSVVENGRLNTYGAQILFLTVLDLIVTCNLLGYNVYAYFVREIHHAEVLRYMVLCVLLYIFGVAFVGILFGAFAAMYMNRFAALSLLTLATFLISPFALFLVESFCMNMNIDLFKIYEFLVLLPRGMESRLPPEVGSALLPDRVFGTLFWILLLGVPLFLKMLKEKKKLRYITSGICAVLAIGCLIGYCQPGGRSLFKNNSEASAFEDYLYYSRNETGRKQKEEESGFHITSYEMDLTVKNCLDAKVTVTPDEPSLAEYPFTLYHGYEIDEIYDQSKTPLPFTREGDYVSVTNSSGRAITSLTFAYHGHCARFYSHSQGIFLSGTFPYYPQSGYRILYDPDVQSFYASVCDPETDFTVQIEYSKPVYSNLDRVGENRFAGKSDGVLLIAGFYEERTVSDIEMVYPYLDSEQFNPEILQKDLDRFLSDTKEEKYGIRKIIAIPAVNLGYDRCHLYSDGTAVCTQVRTLKDNLPLSFILPIKHNLWYVADSYISNRPDFENRLLYEQNMYEKTGEKGYAILLREAVDTVGEEKTLREIQIYLKNGKDSRSPEEFFEALKGDGK